MGQATIISGGENGRYTIRVDYGDDIKTAALAALSILTARLDVRLAQAQTIFNEAQARVDLQQTAYEAAVDAFATAYKQILPGDPFPDQRVIVDALKELRKRQMEMAPFRTQLEAVKLERAKTLKDIARWNQVQTLVTKQAWCADFTETVTPGSWVATIDISGESALTLVYPGGRAPSASDGRMTTPAVMSPAQSAFNFAIFPGWQIAKPTYRRGVITAIDRDANTADVALDQALSSAQRLNINRSPSLSGVPITYMTCHHLAFNVGDRVVVRFDGQSWASPRLIGFLDNPKPCRGWQALLCSLTQNFVSGTPRYLTTVFRCVMPNARYLSEISAASSIAVDFRIDGGDWQTPLGPTAGPITAGNWTNPSGPGGEVVAGLLITLSPPDLAPSFDGTSFDSSEGAPAHLRISAFVDSGWAPDAIYRPFYPLNSIIEVRIRLDGSVFANVAVRLGFKPIAVDSGASIPSSVADMIPLEYTRFVEE